jgi:hypothetical protein
MRFFCGCVCASKTKWAPVPEREPRGGRRARGARGMREIGTDPAPEEKTENLYFFFSHTLVFLLYTPKAVKKATAYSLHASW